MNEKGRSLQSDQLVQIKAAAEIPSIKHTVKITVAQSLAVMKARGGTAGSKGLAEAAMTALDTQLAGAVAANTVVVGRAHLVKSAAGAILVTVVVALQPALPAAARNRATAGVPADMVGGGADAAIGASSAVAAEDAPNLAEVVKSKARAVRKVEEGDGGTVGRLIGGLVIAAAAKTRGVLGSMVRRGIAMATKKGAKTAASGMGEVRTFLPAARATTGLIVSLIVSLIVTEGMQFSTGDLRHQQWRSCRRWTMSARLQSIRHSMVKHRCWIRRTILTVLPQSTATRSTLTLNAMDRRQAPNKPLRRQRHQYLHHEPCLQPWPPHPRLLCSLPESAGEKRNRHGVCTA